MNKKSYIQAIDDVFVKIINNEIKGITMTYPPEAFSHVFRVLKAELILSAKQRKTPTKYVCSRAGHGVCNHEKKDGECTFEFSCGNKKISDK